MTKLYIDERYGGHGLRLRRNPCPPSENNYCHSERNEVKRRIENNWGNFLG